MHPSTISRRDVFKLIAAASAVGALAPTDLIGQTAPAFMRKNTSSDPDFQRRDLLWEKPLAPSELATLTVLCDIIIPGDELAPPPSEIAVAEFLSEWVGAPYPQNFDDLATIRGGLAWLNTHCESIYGSAFTKLIAAQQTAVLDSICDPNKTAPELAPGAVFFKKLRMLTLGGYYSHSSTWKSLGYVGNTPIAGPYPGVPDEVLKILGVENEW